jgi:hypothetical protein
MKGGRREPARSDRAGDSGRVTVGGKGGTIRQAAADGLNERPLLERLCC